MDYEKKYNEALERARKAYNAIKPENYGARKIIENAFPELAESEDERIRRTLVEYFGPKVQLDFVRGVPIQKIRDWLEKQKESLHIPETCKEKANSFTSEQKEQKPLITGNDFGWIDELKHDLKHPEELDQKVQEVLKKRQKPVKKEIALTDFEETLNTFLFDFANSPIEDCEPKEYIKKHSAEILKAAYKELNTQLQQDLFEAKQEGRREGYEVAKE